MRLTIRTVLMFPTMVLLPAGILPAQTVVQATEADYVRADAYRASVVGLTRNIPDTPTWSANSARFWYRKSVAGGNAFTTVIASTGAKTPSFDHERLARAIAAAGGRAPGATALPFATFNYTDSAGTPTAITYVADSANWRCSLTDYVCRKGERLATPFQGGGGGAFRAADTMPRRSPDGKYEAVSRNYNIAIRTVASREMRTLSTDGSEGNAYRLSSLRWSPDSKAIAVYRVKPGYRRMVHYVESSPEDQLQPKSSERFYAKPGDALDVEQPVLFQLAAPTQIEVATTLFPNAYDMGNIEWYNDGRAFHFDYNQRGHQAFRIIEVDANTGAARAVVNEETPTFFNYSSKSFASYPNDGREIIWMSERDGWNHLYLYDGTTGRVKNQITKGAWPVRRVLRVDDAKRQIWFTANGMRAGEDPYLVNYYRINFDGTGLLSLTSANGMHTVTFAPDSNNYVDTWSRIDAPTRSQLRRVSDPSFALDLEQGDISALVATGWRPPETFVAKGRDSKTDIWGIVLKPSNFDASKRYPVIEYIYAGPQDSFVPKTFSPYLSMQSLAELGFIVVQIDGMGTSNRSKAFHDVAWKNLGDAGFPDRILWHRAFAQSHAWYDTSRVGIYGTSAGGQNSMGALLFHPEFYKVAVSAAGCHDNRMDKIWWNEQWMGWPIGPQYSKSSNVDNAGLLQGKLLLVVGEMDTNVDPSSTLQVSNALIKSNKMFDLLFVPGMGHSDGGAYGQRKRNDFFVHNLQRAEPPDRNAAPSLTRTGSR